MNPVDAKRGSGKESCCQYYNKQLWLLFLLDFALGLVISLTCGKTIFPSFFLSTFILAWRFPEQMYYTKIWIFWKALQRCNKSPSKIILIYHKEPTISCELKTPLPLPRPISSVGCAGKHVAGLPASDSCMVPQRVCCKFPGKLWKILKICLGKNPLGG